MGYDTLEFAAAIQEQNRQVRLAGGAVKQIDGRFNWALLYWHSILEKWEHVSSYDDLSVTHESVKRVRMAHWYTHFHIVPIWEFATCGRLQVEF